MHANGTRTQKHCWHLKRLCSLQYVWPYIIMLSPGVLLCLSLSRYCYLASLLSHGKHFSCLTVVDTAQGHSISLSFYYYSPGKITLCQPIIRYCCSFFLKSLGSQFVSGSVHVCAAQGFTTSPCFFSIYTFAVHCSGLYISPCCHCSGLCISPRCHCSGLYISPCCHCSGLYISPRCYCSGLYISPCCHCSGISCSLFFCTQIQMMLLSFAPGLDPSHIFVSGYLGSSSFELNSKSVDII